MSPKKQHRSLSSRQLNQLDLVRPVATRAIQRRALIVCGGITEGNYFEEMRASLNFTATDIRVVAEGLAPVTIAQKAKEIVEAEKADNNPYDEIFCVIDHDGKDEELRQAVALINQYDRIEDKVNWHPIISKPCFEVWPLLHFGCPGPLGTPAKTESELKQKEGMEKYIKPGKGLYKQLESKINLAVKTAQRLEVDNRNTKSDDPSTDVHKVYLFMYGESKKLKG